MSSDQCSNNEYVMELLRRVRMGADQNAWAEVRQCLDRVIRVWLYRYPNRDALFQADNVQNYLDATFERFWQLTIDHQTDFKALSTMMQYLFVSLNGVILDRLRACSPPEDTHYHKSFSQERH